MGCLPCTGTDQPFHGMISELLYSLLRVRVSDVDYFILHTFAFEVAAGFLQKSEVIAAVMLQENDRLEIFTGIFSALPATLQPIT